MDALSDLLRVLRFTGGVFLDATFRTPWCVYSQVTREDCTPDTPSASLVAFHYVLDGHVEISIGDAPPRACRGGDLFVVVRNDGHRFGSDLSLSALHGRVAHPWTTEQLADEALMSRSAFAERFARTLGVPPMTYLTRWRMLVAAQRLRESRASIGQIAADVGYESESTFTRAYTREMGITPGAYRRSQPAA